MSGNVILMVQNLYRSLRDAPDPLIVVDEIVDEFVKNYNLYKFDRQQERMKIVSAMNNKVDNNSDSGNSDGAVADAEADANADDDDDDDDDDIDPIIINSSTVPFLSSFGLPIKKRFISPLLRDIVHLSNTNPKKRLLTYQKSRGDKSTLLNIFKLKTKKSFLKYAMRTTGHRSNWLRELPFLLNPNRNDSEAVNWILYYYGKKYKDEFVDVCEQLKHTKLSHKMSAETAAEMWQKAHVKSWQQRIILKYMLKEFGVMLVVPIKYVTQCMKDNVEKQNSAKRKRNNGTEEDDEEEEDDDDEDNDDEDNDEFELMAATNADD